VSLLYVCYQIDINHVMRESVWPGMGGGFVVDQTIQNTQFQVRKDKLGASLRRDAIGHGEPEDAPAQDAEDSKKIRPNSRTRSARR
jgi:hypothetical protein